MSDCLQGRSFRFLSGIHLQIPAFRVSKILRTRSLRQKSVSSSFILISRSLNYKKRGKAGTLVRTLVRITNSDFWIENKVEMIKNGQRTTLT